MNKQQTRIVTNVRRWMADNFIADHIHAACLWWAAATVVECHRHGLNVVLQAGTAMFRRLAADRNECFSYVYEGDTPRNRMALACGNMPEMHVWCGDVDNQQVIDLTTGYQKQQAAILVPALDFDYQLPDIVWRRGSEVFEHDGVLYDATAEPTIMACGFIQNPKQLAIRPAAHRQLVRELLAVSRKHERTSR